MVDIGKVYWSSLEGEKARNSLKQAFSSTNKAVSGIRSTISAVQKAWDFELGDQSNIETTDQYIEKLSSAFSGVIQNNEVRQSLEEVSASTKFAATEISSAVKVTTTKITEEAKKSETLQNAVKNIAKGIQAFIFFIKMKADSSKTIGFSRTLPPSKDP